MNVVFSQQSANSGIDFDEVNEVEIEFRLVSASLSLCIGSPLLYEIYAREWHIFKNVLGSLCSPLPTQSS